MAAKEGFIEYEDFLEITIKVGIVKKCEVHQNADSLLVFSVDIGEPELRTICSGVRETCIIGEMVGKRVLVVTNIRPRTMRGMPSDGRLLSIIDTATGKHRLITAEDTTASAGSEVR